MHLELPKLTSRLYKPFDWYGWAMSILGLVLMCKFGGVGWVFGTTPNWWLFAVTFFIFWEYAERVAYGRIYKFVYYDTIIHRMYELDVSGKRFFVNAETEEELDLYMQLHYPDMEFTVVSDTHTESFIKTERHV